MKPIIVIFLIILSTNWVLSGQKPIRNQNINNPITNSSILPVVGNFTNKLSDTINIGKDFFRFANKETVKSLEKLKINSLSDLLPQIGKVKNNISKQSWNELKFDLSLTNITNNQNLINSISKNNIKSLDQFSKLSTADIVNLSQKTLSPIEAKTILDRTKLSIAYAHYLAMRKTILLRNAELFGGLRIWNPDSIRLNPIGQSELPWTFDSIGFKKDFPFGGVNINFGGGCQECNDNNNLLSPGVYVLYLIDFITEVFDSNLDDVQKLNLRLYQELEAVATHSEVDKLESYVKYSNQILENYLADILSQKNGTYKANFPFNEWPNHSKNTGNSLQKKIDDEVSKTPGVPFPLLMADLFEAYLTELGTDRQELKISLLNPKLCSNLEQRLGVENGKIYNLFNNRSLEDLDIKLQYLEDIKSVIKQKVTLIATEEQRKKSIKEHANEFKSLFLPVFLKEKEECIKLLTSCHLDQLQIIPSNQELDELLIQISSKNYSCIEYNNDCPKGCNLNKLFPLYRIKSLYKFYYDKYPKAAKVGSPQQVIDSLKDVFKQERLNNLKLLGVNSNFAQDSLEVENRLRSQDEFQQQLEVIGKFILNFELGTYEQFYSSYNREIERIATESFEIILTKVETSFQEKLRENLLYCIKKNRGGLIDASKETLGNFLLLDLEMSAKTEITAIGFLISRLHSLIQLAEIGIANKDPFNQYNSAGVISEKFKDPRLKEQWKWLSSYGTWHAAMMTSLYPENFLEPRFRKNTTDHFKDNIYQVNQPDPEKYWREVTALADMAPLALIQSSGYTYFLASNSINEINYSVLRPDGTWKPWLASPKSLGGLGALNLEGNNWKKYLKILESPNGHNVIFAAFEETPRGYQPYYSNLTLEKDELTIATKWKALMPIPSPKRTQSLNQNVYIEIDHINNVSIISPLGSFPSFESNEKYDLSFAVCYINPQTAFSSKLPDETVLQDTLIPYMEYWVYSIADDSYKLEFNRKIKSNFFEQVRSLISNPHGKEAIGILSTDKDGVNQLRLGNIGGDEIYYDKDPSNNSFRFKRISSDIKDFSPNHYYTYYAQIGVLYDNSNNEHYKLKVGSSGYEKKIGIFISDVSGKHINGKTVAYGKDEYGIYYTSVESDYRDKRYLTPINLSKILIDENHNIFNDKPTVGPARIYDEEALIHIPLYMSNFYDKKNLFPEAINWISRIISLNKLTPLYAANTTKVTQINHPIIGLLKLTGSILSIDIENPFDPYSIAEKNRVVYWANIKLQHAELLVAWANQLFREDNIESVNRARELYELALKVLSFFGDLNTNECAMQTNNLEDISDVLFSGNELSGLIQKALSEGFDIVTISQIGAALGEKLSISAKQQIIKSELYSSAQPTSNQKLDYYLKTDNPENLKTSESTELFAIYQIGENTLNGEVDSNFLPEKIYNLLGIKPFCIPKNPKYKTLLWTITSNLEKIRTNRNYAGFERQLPPYALTVNPDKMIAAQLSNSKSLIDVGGISQVPLFRYSFLIERARKQAQQAQQYESSLLNNIKENEQNEFRFQYDHLKAKQDLKLQESMISLKNISVNDSYFGLNSASAQVDQTKLKINNYETLLTNGRNTWEDAALVGQYTAAASYGLASFVQFLNAGMDPFKVATGVSSLASASQAFSSASQMQASFERRTEEWRFMKRMSESDKKIAEIGVEMARSRVKGAHLEKQIAELQSSFINDQLSLFQNRRDLELERYNWMQRHMKQLYLEHLSIAQGAAQLAQRALEFEKQNAINIIGYNYGEYMNETNNRYVGAEKLIQDIEKLDNYRVSSTSERPKEIEKTISLASIAPVEFQQFRESGILEFETLMNWFDRDFPGHKMRLIRDLDVKVIGLIPPIEGIKATLYNDGFSRVVVDPAEDKPRTIYKYPESIALSGTNGGNGLFVLKPDDPMLYPFEGNGVASRWVFEMPKGSNPIDYNSIADILFSIRYTAQEDRAYRQEVLKQMKQDVFGLISISSKRYFSIRSNYPDQWFAFQNPNCGIPKDQLNDPITDGIIKPGKPIQSKTILLNIRPQDFLPNEEQKNIRKITLAVKLRDSLDFIPVSSKVLNFKLRFFPSSVGAQPKPVVDLRVQNNKVSTSNYNFLSPFGTWVLQLNQPCDDSKLPIKLRDIEDILFVIDYEAKVHYNR